MIAPFTHRLRLAAASAALVLSTAAGCRPSAPSSPSETAAQFYTLLDGLGVRGVPDSLALDAVQPHLDSTLVRLLVEARHARDSVARLVPREKPPFIDGDMFSSLFEGNTSFGIRRVATRGDTTLAVMAFTNAMQPRSALRRQLGLRQSRYAGGITSRRARSRQRTRHTGRYTRCVRHAPLRNITALTAASSV